MLNKPSRGILPNKSHPLQKGLIGLWIFNEGTGNQINDLSGNQNTGIASGGSWNYPSPKAMAWNSMYTSNIDCGTNSILEINSPNMTYVLRMKLESSISGGITFFCKGYYKQDGYYLKYDRNYNSFEVWTNQYDARQYSYGIMPELIDTWTTVIVTINNGSPECYLNGVGDKFTSHAVHLGPDCNSTRHLHLSSRSDGLYPVPALFECLRLYNRPLTEGERHMLDYSLYPDFLFDSEGLKNGQKNIL